MKIIIIEPYDFNPRYDQRSLTPSPGPVVVATRLSQNGHDVQVISEYVSEINYHQTNKADLIGISITTFNAKRGFKIARKLEAPVVFGGFHASLAPEECLKYGDFVIRGDGHSMGDLAEILTKAKFDDIGCIPNLVYRKNGKTHFNRSETKAQNITPNFNLVKDYYKFNIRRLLRIPLLVNASRGCTFNCTFCSIKAVYPDFKKKNIRTVIDDIKSQISNQHFLSRFLPRIIWITDDNFTSDKKWAKALLNEIAKLKTRFKFTIQLRTDAADDDQMLRRMKQAGFGRVYLGIESLDQRSLKNFEKNSSIEQFEHAVKKIRNQGIDVHGLFVFGDDEFQKGDGLRVADFAIKNRLTGVLIQPLTPYPGTRIYRELEKENRILHHNWQDYNGKVVFQPKNMSPAELQKEVYDCYRKIFSPMQVLKFFASGQKGFKLEFFGEAMIRHLERLKIKKYLNDKLVELDDQRRFSFEKQPGNVSKRAVL